MTHSIFRVRIERVGGWVEERDLTGDQEAEGAKVQHLPNGNYTDSGIARLKTETGECSAIFRNGRSQEKVVHATPDRPGEYRFSTGEVYRLSVVQVRAPDAPVPIDLAKASFKPPAVRLERVTENGVDGLRIRFEAGSRPGIFTLAPEGAAKPLGLPSLPFPEHFPDGRPRTSVSLFIPIVDVEPPTKHGEGTPFLLAEHTHVRVGIRGTGLFVRGIPIPKPGGRARLVAPEDYQYLAAQVDRKWLDPNKILEKYNEKHGHLRYE